MKKIGLQLFDQPVRISTNDALVTSTISACYSAFMQPIQSPGVAPIELAVYRKGSQSKWFVDHAGTRETCSDLADLIFVIEKTMTLELQRRRPDLFFLHAAAVRAKNRCVVIVGESGAGKSTFCWTLCNLGFSYISDELVPVNLETIRVEPYPHAICLKRKTDGMPKLPDETLHTVGTLHIPVDVIPGGFERGALVIDSIVFLKLADSQDAPRLTSISTSEAAARLYSNGLNQLAHECDGLRAATRLAVAVNCFGLTRGALHSMRSELIRGIGL